MGRAEELIKTLKCEMGSSEADLLDELVKELKGQKGFFPITFVCRDDIPEAFGFPRIQKKAAELAATLTDEDMKQLAAFIGEQCCESDVYWHAINDWMCDKFGDKLE